MVQTNELIERIRNREMPALARAISLVENGRAGFESILSSMYQLVGNAYRIGITGPPGAGKSTLAERVVQRYRALEKTVAVVAVDPTSPFTGGALLGDRIRMESVALDPGVYIRSMATRGAPGGLATTTREVADVLDAFGFDRVIIETVGVGQSELAIAASADTAVLVLVPESGDGVQVLKAGVMEIADLYVVNKADRPGADRLVLEVETMLGFRRGQAYRDVTPHHRAEGRRPEPTSGPPGTGWTPRALTTVATSGDGVEALVDALEAHYTYLQESGDLARRRRERAERHTREVVNRTLSTLVWREGNGEDVLKRGMDSVTGGQRSPYELAHEILATYRKQGTEHA